MTITKIAAFACGIFLFFSCSNLQLAGLAGSGKKVVASEQKISTTTIKKNTVVEPVVEPVVRTLLIKSDANEKSMVLVAGIALKDSTTLSTYSVIVGSYTQPGKSVQLIEKLKQKSLSPFFVRNEKGMYRMVAGTFQNKDDADFLMLKLDVDDIDAWILERFVTPVTPK
jgi:SPOR domain